MTTIKSRGMIPPICLSNDDEGKKRLIYNAETNTGDIVFEKLFRGSVSRNISEPVHPKTKMIRTISVET